MGIVILDKELQAELDAMKKETRTEFYSKHEWFDSRDDDYYLEGR